ncbi:hypothetical protein ACFLSJ_00130 [Verrucomicrobiota bacterium]
MRTQTQIALPHDYTLVVDSLSVCVRRDGGDLQPFGRTEDEGALPSRIHVMTRQGAELATEELFEKDFADIRLTRPSDTETAISGLHRGLRLSQDLKWTSVSVEGRSILRLSRRVRVHVEDIRFNHSDHIRVLGLTHWGNLARDKSYELSTNMGWHHHRSFRQTGHWRYFAWNTPYMANYDGMVCPHEGYMNTDVHTMGLAEYTAISWPDSRYAVMVAIDPVEYLERGICHDWMMGPANIGLDGWFEPSDCGACYETAWQHYYFLEDEDNPLVSTANVWREEFARNLNPYLMPESELDPWFATENWHGPRVGSDYPTLWDGNVTALEQHYEELRRDPLLSGIHPLLFHERPGFCTLQTEMSRYYHAKELPIGWVQFNVPLTHHKGERLTITCGVTLNTREVDIRWELELTGSFFQVRGVALTRHSPFGAIVPEVSPERVDIRQGDDKTGIRVSHSAAALQRDFEGLDESYYPFIEIRLDVVEEIPEDAGVVEGSFFYRPAAEREFTRIPLIRNQEEERGEFRFPPEPYPVKVMSGVLKPGISHKRVRAYRKNADIFLVVRDGKPVRIAREDFIPRMAELMRKYDISITCYVASYGMCNYDALRNPNWLLPNILALGPDRKPKKIWYLGGCRSDRFCAASRERAALVDAAIRELLAVGPFGLYVDEIQGNVGSCFSRDHGHGLSSGRRLAHCAGDRMRQVARDAGMPHMYVGTEVGGLLQHTFAQGHNFEGTDPSRKDELFEEVKRMALAQIAYGYEGSRAFFNYCFEGAQPNMAPADGIFGHALGLAFPRFSLAPWTGQPSPIGTYFATGVKRAFKEHYRYGRTQIPDELVLPGSKPDTLALVLESDVGRSVHLANLSSRAAALEADGMRARLEHGCACLADTFGNAMGETGAIEVDDERYLGFDRPVCFGLWRTDEGVFLRILETGRAPLAQPVRVFLSQCLVDRTGPDRAMSWQALDSSGTATDVSATPVENGLELVYPNGPECRCLKTAL